MTEESVYENSNAERLNGVIKNNYLYPYNPSDFNDLKKKLKKAVKMYNTEKGHRALGGMTPVQYKSQKVIENKDNNPCYLPFSTTINQHQKNNKLLSNLVNVI
jgi:hypothetical protein